MSKLTVCRCPISTEPHLWAPASKVLCQDGLCWSSKVAHYKHYRFMLGVYLVMGEKNFCPEDAVVQEADFTVADPPTGSV